MAQMPMTAVIIAGGQSRRMQTDKAFVKVGGKWLIERVIEAITPLFDEVLINTNTPAKYQGWGLPAVPDVWPDKGALGGIYTALRAATHPTVFCVACDMPTLNRNVIRLIQAQAAHWDVVVPRLPDGLHPLHAIYTKPCAEPIHGLLARDSLKIAPLFELVRTHYLAAEAIRQIDPHFRSFANLNTHEDLQRAQTNII